MCLASSVSWLLRPESLVRSRLLFLQCDLWSIIGDSGLVVSSLVSSASTSFSFHLLTGKMGTRPMILLHGFIKKTPQTPKRDLDLAQVRKVEIEQSEEETQP